MVVGDEFLEGMLVHGIVTWLEVDIDKELTEVCYMWDS